MTSKTLAPLILSHGDVFDDDADRAGAEGNESGHSTVDRTDEFKFREFRLMNSAKRIGADFGSEPEESPECSAVPFIAGQLTEAEAIGHRLIILKTRAYTVDDLGIGYLADSFELRIETGQWPWVRLAEVSPHEIRVKKDGWGEVNALQLIYTLSFPTPRGYGR